MTEEVLKKLERDARRMKRLIYGVDYVLFPLGCVLSVSFAVNAYRAETPFWFFFNAAFFAWATWANIGLVLSYLRRRKLRNHKHDFTTITSYHHAETDEDDPVCHTAFTVLGCRECGTAFLFPMSNAVLTTRRFRKELYADMKKLGWKLPEF